MFPKTEIKKVKNKFGDKMVWQQAKIENENKNIEQKETETLQPEFEKEYILQIKRMGTNDKGDWYLVTDEEGQDWWLPNHYDLKQKLKEFPKIEEDDYISIKHVEDKDIGKENPLKIYDVFWDDGEPE